MKLFKGIGAAPGVVGARTLYFEKKPSAKQNITIDDAISKSLERVRLLHKKAMTDLGNDKAKIFAAYEMLLEDSMLTDPIKKAVSDGEEPEVAVRNVTESMAKILSSKNNEYMRQRADDIRYIGELIIDTVNGTDGGFSFPDGDEKFILAAYELTPVDTMMFDYKRLAGLITVKGGSASHTVILAKSLGIPAIVGAEGLTAELEGEKSYLDGYSGMYVVSPDARTEEEYSRKINDEELLNKQLEKIKSSEAVTKDGERIKVCINIGKPSDMNGTENEKIDGVGLFRSEFLYSSSKKKPTCEEQTKAYREVIEKAKPNLVTIRTLDAGGDKQIEYLNMTPEENPFLGNRGIRLCLNNPEVFSEQLRAILLAAAGEKVKIMLPMITSLDEIERAKAMIADVKAQLDGEGLDYSKDTLVGIMIETPASAVMADVFAKYADFFSIGTNDLVQYITAADRGNAQVENLYNPYHPAVLRTLANVIRAGENAGIEVSVCGDLAANTAFTEILLGMGLKTFSVPLPMASRIKYKISNTSSGDARELTKKVLAAESANEIKNILRGEQNGC